MCVCVCVCVILSVCLYVRTTKPKRMKLQSDRQTNRQTHRITDADDRYTDPTTVCVSHTFQYV